MSEALTAGREMPEGKFCGQVQWVLDHPKDELAISWV
jgi:hypothetical protein